MKKLLVFVFAIVPMGLIVSPILSIVLGVIVACRSMADYWEGVVMGWFGPDPIKNNPQKTEGVWERYQRELDERNKEEEGSTNTD
jgi:hypothetical protein